MSELVWYPAYRDEYAGGLYPFGDASTLVSDDGSIALMPGMLVDAAIYPIGGVDRARIAAISVAPRLITVTLGDSGSAATASASFDPLAAPSTLDLLDPLGRPAGLLVADPTALAAAQTWPQGTYTFAVGVAEFAARCVFPVPSAGVLSVAAAGSAATGDVWLVGDAGVVLSSPDGSTIRVDVVGDPLSGRRVCEDPGLFTTPPLVTSLAVSDGTNPPVVLTPDDRGDVQIVVGSALAADTALRLVPTADGFKIGVVGPALAH